MLKKTNFKIVFVFLLAILSLSSSFKNIENKWRYDVEGVAGQGLEGTDLIKIWTYTKTPKKNYLEQAKKNAVHAIIFRGYTKVTQDKNIQKPFTQDLDAEQKNIAFYNAFFADGGPYQNFVELVNNGTPGIGDLIKIGKEYKVATTVIVKKNALRKHLEESGVLKTLGQGF